jgi:hypothetical protein
MGVQDGTIGEEVVGFEPGKGSIKVSFPLSFAGASSSYWEGGRIPAARRGTYNH